MTRVVMNALCVGLLVSIAAGCGAMRTSRVSSQAIHPAKTMRPIPAWAEKCLPRGVDRLGPATKYVGLKWGAAARLGLVYAGGGGQCATFDDDVYRSRPIAVIFNVADVHSPRARIVASVRATAGWGVSALYERPTRSPISRAVAETYVLPNSDTTRDGLAYVLVKHGSRSLRTTLGRLTEVGIRAAPSGFIGTGFSQGTASGSFFHIPIGGLRPGRLIPTPTSDMPVIGDNGRHYFVQVGAEIRELSRTGSVVRTTHLKTRHATGTIGAPQKGGLSTAPSPGVVAAYVTGPDGEEYAVADTPAGIVVINLGSGEERQIASYDATLDATFSTDGHVMILAASPNDPTSTVHLLWVDPNSLAIAGTADTGLDPSSADLTGYEVLSTANHGVFVFLASYTGSSTIDQLWQADSSTMTLAPATQLPDDVGISAAVDSTDRLYFFNGPAVNVVSSWNPSNDAFTPDHPPLDGPAGSYVTGLAF